MSEQASNVSPQQEGKLLVKFIFKVHGDMPAFLAACDKELWPEDFTVAGNTITVTSHDVVAVKRLSDLAKMNPDCDEERVR